MIDHKLMTVDKVEILTLQDNYIEMTAMGQQRRCYKSRTVERWKNQSVHWRGARVFGSGQNQRGDGKTHTLLFDFGFSEDGAAKNARRFWSEDMQEVEAAVLSHGHSDHTGVMSALGAPAIGKKNLPLALHPAALKAPRYLKWGEEIKDTFPGRRGRC